MNNDNLRVEQRIPYDGICTEGLLREIANITIKKLHINESIRLKLGGGN